MLKFMFDLNGIVGFAALLQLLRYRVHGVHQAAFLPGLLFVCRCTVLGEVHGQSPLGLRNIVDLSGRAGRQGQDLPCHMTAVIGKNVRGKTHDNGAGNQVVNWLHGLIEYGDGKDKAKGAVIDIKAVPAFRLKTAIHMGFQGAALAIFRINTPPAHGRKGRV